MNPDCNLLTFSGLHIQLHQICLMINIFSKMISITYRINTNNKNLMVYFLPIIVTLKKDNLTAPLHQQLPVSANLFHILRN